MIDLNKIYTVTAALNRLVADGTLTQDDVSDNISIKVIVPPQTHYGIDKEFYRQSNNNNLQGFEHIEAPIIAVVDGVRLEITAEQNDMNNSN